MFYLGLKCEVDGVQEGLENKDTILGQCNKLKFKGDKLGYNSNWPIKPNVTMLVATVYVEQQLKKEKEVSLLPLFKKSPDKSFQIMRLKFANRFVRRETLWGWN